MDDRGLISDTSDETGSGKKIEPVEPGTLFHVSVMREHTRDYKNIASMTAQPGHRIYSFISPKLRIELTTQPLKPSDQLEVQPSVTTQAPSAASQTAVSNATDKVPANAPAAPDKKPGNSSAPVSTKIEVTYRRDDQQLPVADIKGTPVGGPTPSQQRSGMWSDWLWQQLDFQFKPIRAWFKNRADKVPVAPAPPVASDKKSETEPKKPAPVNAPSKSMPEPPKGQSLLTSPLKQHTPVAAPFDAGNRPLPAAQQSTLNKLVALAEQISHYDLSGTDSLILNKLILAGALDRLPGKPVIESRYVCLRGVKLALFGAGMTAPISGPNLAKDAPNALLAAGFKDVTHLIPHIEMTYYRDVPKDDDKAKGKGKPVVTHVPYTVSQPFILMCCPGDVIVYEQVRPENPKAAGHIDIRTYHGFISDFECDRAMPRMGGIPASSKNYEVIGIYRKVSDTFAIQRLEKFLEILSDLETKGIPRDQKPFALFSRDPVTQKLTHRFFTDTSMHPFSENSLHYQQGLHHIGKVDQPSSSGAFQMNLGTYRGLINEYGLPPTFDLAHQKLLAVLKLQQRRLADNRKDNGHSRTALGYLLAGNIKAAIQQTTVWQEWSSLPQPNGRGQITLENLLALFKDYSA